jgi:hypothetical protein
MAILFRAFRVSPLCFFLAAGFARADEAMISKAREFIGAERDLCAVHALRFRGELSVDESKGGAPIVAQLEIVFERPDRQVITATASDKIETTALNGYEAWQREVPQGDPAGAKVGLLGREAVKRLRANTFENLAFYRGIEAVGGKREERGLAKVDGVDCVKIAFVHSPDVVFIRSFERDTGRLVLTETDNGSEIRETGEIRAGNLRFPQSIITKSTLSDGAARIITITFKEITVNPVIPDALFEMPASGL